MGGNALWECEAMVDGAGRGCALSPSPLTAGVIAWPRSPTRVVSAVLSGPQHEFQSDQQGRSLPPLLRAKIIGLCPGDCAKIAIQLLWKGLVVIWKPPPALRAPPPRTTSAGTPK